MRLPENLILALLRNNLSPFYDYRYPNGDRPLPTAIRQFVDGYFTPAKFNLSPDRIISPRPDNETHVFNFTKNAHVGIQYEIRINIQGGAYPCYFDVVSMPVGATLGETYLDDDYGVIKWTPTETGIENFHITVTDQDGISVDIEWTVNVNTDWVRFVSSSGSNFNDGSYDSPWQTFGYALDNVTGGRAICLREGTYTESFTGKSIGTSFANTIFAPPGETVIIDASNYVNSSSHGFFMVNSNDFSIFNLTLRNPPNNTPNPRWVSTFAVTDRLLMDKCTFLINGRSGTENSDNVSTLFLGNPGSQRKYVSQTRCVFDGFSGLQNGWSSIDTYQTRYFLVEDNIFQNQVSGTGSAGVIWVKATDSEDGTIRKNVCLDSWAGYVWEISLSNSSGDNATGNIEVCYNTMRGPTTQSTNNIIFGIGRGTGSGARSPIYSYRNTILGNVAIWNRDYPLTFSSENDIIITDATYAGKPHNILYRDGNTADNVWANPSARANLTLSITNTECHGSTSSGILDGDLKLTGSYLQYLGRYGAEIESGVNELWKLAADFRVGQKMPMRTLYPLPDTETPLFSFHRNAHSNILHEVPVCVQGGERPFKYELITAPVGATIVSEFDRVTDPVTGLILHEYPVDYGVVKWMPTSGTHSFVVRVTDQSGDFVDVSWSTSINDANYVIIDSSVVSSGSGTWNSPLKTWADLWGNATSNTYANKIAYFKAGTYQVAESGVNSCSINANQKPVALIGAGSDVVTFDTSNGHFFLNVGDFVFKGIKFTGSRNDENNRIIQVSFKNDNYLFYDLFFDDITIGTVGNDNASCIMFFDDAAYTNNVSVVSCKTGSNCDVQLICTYTVDGCLVENCYLGADLPTSNGAQGIHIKDDTRNCTVSFNTVNGNFPSGHIRISNQQTLSNGSYNQEVCYNTIIDTASDWTFEGSALSWNQNSTGFPNPTGTYSYRNTIKTIKYVHTFRDWLDSGNFVQTSGNVWYGFAYAEGTAYTEVIPNSVQIQLEDLDVDGKLTDTNNVRTTHLGKLGAEIASS